MKRKFSILITILAWFAVVTQYYLMLENRVTPIFETTVRFFSFFTILTNLLVAIYFSLSLRTQDKRKTLSILDKPGTLTAVTVYITVVGLVYQVLLRHIWEPTGIQMVVDELLHSVIPLAVIIFWYLYEDKSRVNYRQIPAWLLYPLCYLVYILIRGHFSDFYPYPFVHAGNLGLLKVLINSAGLLVVFVGISALFILVGKGIKRKFREIPG